MRMRGEIRTVMGATDWLLLLALGALWGGSYFFGKVALAQLGPFSVAVGRLGLAAVVLHMVVRVATPGRQRARGHPQREHAALHRAPRSLLHDGRAPDLGKDRRGALRSGRRGSDDR